MLDAGCWDARMDSDTVNRPSDPEKESISVFPVQGGYAQPERWSFNWTFGQTPAWSDKLTPCSVAPTYQLVTYRGFENRCSPPLNPVLISRLEPGDSAGLLAMTTRTCILFPMILMAEAYIATQMQATLEVMPGCVLQPRNLSESPRSQRGFPLAEVVDL